MCCQRNSCCIWIEPKLLWQVSPGRPDAAKSLLWMPCLYLLLQYLRELQLLREPQQTAHQSKSLPGVQVRASLRQGSRTGLWRARGWSLGSLPASQMIQVNSASLDPLCHGYSFTFISISGFCKHICSAAHRCVLVQCRPEPAGPLPEQHAGGAGQEVSEVCQAPAACAQGAQHPVELVCKRTMCSIHLFSECHLSLCHACLSCKVPCLMTLCT